MLCGELTLAMWASNSSRNPFPAASAYWEHFERDRKVLWIKYENKYGSSYASSSTQADAVLSILDPEFKSHHLTPAEFKPVQALLEIHEEPIQFMQSVRFLDVELGNWYCFIDSEGAEQQVGAISLGEPGTFLLASKPGQTVVQGPAQCHSSWKLLTTITFGRILWDSAHIVAIVSIGCTPVLVLSGRAKHKLKS